ncbi:VirB4 family type IV secretion system protein [Halomicrococcus sp. NG-SE-24]|uniref:VirB4 family type IV secretion system protein n=1 Tax=Halomicrococcus sp. NG-SE-24 TaxID=3436928 RepID=UPI003D98AF5B
MSLIDRLIQTITGAAADQSDRLDDAGRHARLVAPSSTQLESDATRTGERWAQTLFVVDWPTNADPGLLETITTHPSADVDLTIHAHPRPTERSITELEDAIRDLESVRLGKQKNGDPSISTTDRRIREHEAVLAQLTDGAQSIFEVAAYVTVRGDTERTVERTCQQLRTELAKRQLTVKPVDYIQIEGLVANSPIADDAVSGTIGAARTPMLSGALGASFPFSASTVIETTGVLYGFHATTDAPVVVDRWQRPNGYNVLAAAKIGSGKSVTAKLLSLREIANDSETILILLDPLEGFHDLATALDADRIIVGGTRQLNPLEIQPTPRHVLEAANDINPYGQQFSSVMDFFETYFAHIDTAGHGLDTNARAVLGRGVREAYRRQGITRDPATHANDSPTVQDVFVILGEMADDASPFFDEEDDGTAPTTVEFAKLEDRAAELRIGMRPLVGDGEYANLGGKSDIDLRDEKVTYLDLQQGEADREIALMMQLLFDAVYDRAKQTDKRMVLAIDEAHYLLQNEGSLAWLDRAYRHSRHHDLSIHLITQELSDFFVHEKAEVLAKEASIKVLQRLPGLTDESRKRLGLNEREARFLRQAKPGTRERGYSHALVCIEDEGRFPVKVNGLSEELALVDSDSSGTHP